MKKIEWLENLSLADKKYVDEANPASVKAKRKIKWGKVTALAACFLAVVFTVTLFIPYNNNPPSVARYSDSEYYSIIQKLNAYDFQRKNAPEAKNLFESIRNALRNMASKDIMYDEEVNLEYADKLESPIMPSVPAEESPYHETTDNQVAGVIEGDRIKRSDKYIYYIDGSELYVYPITGKDESPVGKYNLANSGDGVYMDEGEIELYLSRDCKTVTVITPFYGKIQSSVVTVRSLDVSDPKNITEKNVFTVEGSYNASRMVDGRLLLITSYNTRISEIDFSDESTFLPTVSSGDDKELIPADCVFAPEELDNTRYTVVTLLSENGLEKKGIFAYLSYSENIYVSEDDIFLTRSFSETNKEDGFTNSERKTEISRLSYKGSLENKGTVTVDGYINNQYNLDVYNGYLRVVTTTQKQRWKERDINIDVVDFEPTENFESINANLYCIDLEDLSIAAEVKSFAPEGETVRSVRFDGTNAYVCTSIQQTDPVFFFDLSDINNITVKDTGTIDGFSSSLVNFGNGFLLGIGTGKSSDTFKIEVYEEAVDGVRSVCSYERERTEYSTDYKSYFIDRENGLVGLGLVSYMPYDEINYVLLHFDGYKLREVINCPLDGYIGHMRGVYIDGSFYMLGSNCMKVLPVFNE